MKETDINEIAANLREVISRLVKIIRNEVKTDEILSLTERSTLSLIHRNTGILASELANMEKVSSQSMSQIINKLLKHGFIKKISSLEDKRKLIITITEAGQERIEKKRHASEEWLAKSIFEKTTQREKEILVEAIPIMTKLVDLK